MECEKCKFYSKWNDHIGECRRNAPRPKSVSGDFETAGNAVWPIVDSLGWCGEWAWNKKRGGE